MGERIDDLHRNGYKLIQNPGGFCFGCDAVLLTGFARVKKNERVMDLCTGSGVIPILLSAKTEGAHFTGIEIQEEMASLAARSVRLNGLDERIDIRQGDVRKVKEDYKHASFDVVTVNPPYIKHMGGFLNVSQSEAAARHEVCLTLEDVVSASAYLLKNGGRLYMIHSPRRLVEIITLSRKYGLEPKGLRQVQPFADKPPEMVLVEARKAGGSMLIMQSALVIYSEPGVYTKEVHDIYFHNSP